MASEPLFLALPESCLLAVMECCADDQHSLLSAARAHSRLHQAAVQVLHSIHAVMTQQQERDSVLQYMGKHGHHVHDMILEGEEHVVFFDQLPAKMQLNSLQLAGLCLSFRAVLDAVRVTALKQLRLCDCKLLNARALAAALPELPASLEHLSISRVAASGDQWVGVSTAVLAKLQQLTYLELAETGVAGSVEGGPVLQPLQALAQLADLRLGALEIRIVPASMLSDMQGLTRLELSGFEQVEPGILAGKTQLQHLAMTACHLSGGPAEEAQLLSHLQHMQQLTLLDLECSLHAEPAASEQDEMQLGPPAAAYSALTASSKLQFLDISSCSLTARAWQHVFPAGRQLQHLQELNISGVKVLAPSCDLLPAPEGSRLVSCCRSLQYLDMMQLQCSKELLAALQGLRGLEVLWVGCGDQAEEGLLLQLTQLKQLQQLCYHGPIFGGVHGVAITHEVSIHTSRYLTCLPARRASGTGATALHVDSSSHSNLFGALSAYMWIHCPAWSRNYGTHSSVVVASWPAACQVMLTQLKLCQDGCCDIFRPLRRSPCGSKCCKSTSTTVTLKWLSRRLQHWRSGGELAAVALAGG
jgi:hypothetical protein